MAERMEGATKHYGVPNLITEELYYYFSDKTKSMCRQVDYCIMKGSDEPRKLYTIDIDSKDIQLEPETKEMNAKQLKI